MVASFRWTFTLPNNCSLKLWTKCSLSGSPVEVVGRTKTSFTFLSLPGHPEGANKHIRFSVFRYWGRHYLQVQAWGPDETWCDHHLACEAANVGLRMEHVVCVRFEREGNPALHSTLVVLMPENPVPHGHVRVRHRPSFALIALTVGCVILAFMLLMLNILSPAFTLLDATSGQYSSVVLALLIARLVFGVLPYAAAILVGVLFAVSKRTSLWVTWAAAGIAFCATGLFGLMVSALSVGGF